MRVSSLTLLPSLALALSTPQPPIASPVAAAAVAPPQVPFEDWAEANNINAPKLAVTGAADLRGVMVLEDVAAGEELCNSYVDVSLPLKKRRRELREYGFDCDCPRCERELAAAADKKAAEKRAGNKAGKRRQLK